MSSPFVAEIRMFGFNFAPRGWASCDGQILPISQNTALFSLLGTTYGGNGQSTFALPNLQGSTPIFWGQGPGLSLRDLGETGGEPTVNLQGTQIPVHQHGVETYTGDPADSRIPSSATSLGVPSPGSLYSTNAAGLQAMNPQAFALAGGSLPHNNMQPNLVVFFAIALQGVFPPRT